MSIFSIILGLIASGFAINGAGNLKEAWNKDYDSFKKSSFFSTKVKWGMNVAKKSTETAVPALIAVESFTGGVAKTAALQSVVDMVGGKLPKNGDHMAKTFSKVGEDLSAPFRSSKQKSDEKQQRENLVAAPAVTDSQNTKNTDTNPGTMLGQENTPMVGTAEINKPEDLVAAPAVNDPETIGNTETQTENMVDKEKAPMMDETKVPQQENTEKL